MHKFFIFFMHLLSLLILVFRFYYNGGFTPKSSYGLLRHADPYFINWNYYLIYKSSLEENWLTSKTKCTSFIDYSFGRCIQMKNMKEVENIHILILQNTPAYQFIYTLLRRLIEVTCLFLVRSLMAVSLLSFVSTSGLILIKGVISNKSRNGKHSPRTSLPKSTRIVVITFLLSGIILLSILVPFCVETIYGKVLLWQVEEILTPSSPEQNLIIRVLIGNQSSFLISNLFNFKILRETLFDIHASGIRKHIPQSLLLKFYLQIQLSLISVVTGIVISSLYLFPVITVWKLTVFFYRTIKRGSSKLEFPRVQKMIIENVRSFPASLEPEFNVDHISPTPHEVNAKFNQSKESNSCSLSDEKRPSRNGRKHSRLPKDNESFNENFNGYASASLPPMKFQDNGETAEKRKKIKRRY
ncbi:uncharacterized protein [Parasteatoda tepidariorum]|uniref:uncharacterized protein isoform X2 n=1 Tax=Parasteatoda tepidariorum TaxID=114398 RepID=UPI00077FB424